MFDNIPLYKERLLIAYHCLIAVLEGKKKSLEVVLCFLV